MKKILFILCISIPIISFGQSKKILRQAAKETDINKKIELYTQAISEDPNNLDAYFYRALAKNDLGDYSGAIVDYSKIILLEPDADTYYNRGNARYSLKDIRGAKDDYEQAYKLDSNFVDALYSLGFAKYDLEDYEGAILHLNHLIKITPNQPKTYHLRASCFAALKNYTLALNDYLSAILADPSADSYFNRGVFYMSINYFEKANKDLSVAISINENNSYAYFYRGTSYMLLGDYNNAITDFELALSFDALDFDAMLGLAMTYYKQNDTYHTKLYFDKATSIIAPETKLKTIEHFKNTYWYQNQYYAFNEILPKLSDL